MLEYVMIGEAHPTHETDQNVSLSELLLQMIKQGVVGSNFQTWVDELAKAEAQTPILRPLEALSKYRVHGVLNVENIPRGLDPQLDALVVRYAENIKLHGRHALAHLLLSRHTFNHFAPLGSIDKLEHHFRLGKEQNWNVPLRMDVEAALKFSMWRNENQKWHYRGLRWK